MLILTRHINETIVINGDIKITVRDIRGQQISLGIHAPKEVDVYREEIYNCIESENQDDTSYPKPHS